MQNLLEMGVKIHEDWLKSEFYHICLWVYLCAIDVWSYRSSFRVTPTGFLGADVGKTIDCVLTAHLLQTVIKLTFVANVGVID